MELTLRLLWFFSIAGLSSDAWLSPFLKASFGWITFPELPFTPMSPDTIFYKYKYLFNHRIKQGLGQFIGYHIQVIKVCIAPEKPS